MALRSLFADTAPDGTPRRPFWHKDLTDGRKTWWKLETIAFVAVTLCTFTLQSFYFGVYFRQEENAYRVTCRIIDLDSEAQPQGGALLGPAVRRAADESIAAKPHFHLGWQIEEDLGRFALSGNGVPSGVSQRGIDADEYARNLVLDQTVFGAVVIHANATSAAKQAYENGSPDYSPLGAASFYYEEARNFYTTNQYLAFYTTKLLEAAGADAGMLFAQRQLNAAAASTAGGAVNFTALSTAIAPPPGRMGFSSSLLTKPFAYSQFNLQPFDQLVGTAATTAGQIYLIIFTFFVGLGFIQAFGPLAPKLTLGSEVLVRILVPFVGYFWISLMYSLVTLAFQVDFTRKYGINGFPLFWCVNFTSMLGLGYAMEFSLALLGPLVFPFFLLFWVICNVSSAFLDLADMDHWYSYGFIMPVWNSIDVAKSVIFGTKNHLGQNFAVNMAWVVVGMTGISLLAVAKRMRSDHVRASSEAKT